MEGGFFKTGLKRSILMGSLFVFNSLYTILCLLLCVYYLPRYTTIYIADFVPSVMGLKLVIMSPFIETLANLQNNSELCTYISDTCIRQTNQIIWNLYSNKARQILKRTTNYAILSWFDTIMLIYVRTKLIHTCCYRTILKDHEVSLL